MCAHLVLRLGLLLVVAGVPHFSQLSALADASEGLAVQLVQGVIKDSLLRDVLAAMGLQLLL